MKKSEEAKTNNIFFKIIYVLIVISILYNMIFFLNKTFLNNEYLTIFGISFFSMKDDLMNNDIGKNDLVIIKEISKKELVKGDIIAYKVNNSIRINRIVEIGKEITTKSTKNYYYDKEKVQEENIIGKRVMNLPFLGIFLNILESQITSFIILMFLVFMFFYNKKMYNKKVERSKKKRKFEIKSSYNKTPLD